MRLHFGAMSLLALTGIAVGGDPIVAAGVDPLMMLGLTPSMLGVALQGTTPLHPLLALRTAPRHSHCHACSCTCCIGHRSLLHSKHGWMIRGMKHPECSAS